MHTVFQYNKQESKNVKPMSGCYWGSARTQYSLWFSDNIVPLQIFQSQQILFQMQSLSTLRPYFFVALAYIEIIVYDSKIRLFYYLKKAVAVQ